MIKALYGSMYNQKNENDQFGMINDLRMEGMKEENFQKRLRTSLPRNRQLVNDEVHKKLLESINSLKLSKVWNIDHWRKTKKKEIKKILLLDYLYFVEQQLVYDGIVPLYNPMENKKGSGDLVGETNDGEEHGGSTFSWKFILVIGLAQLIIVITSLNLFMRKTRIIRYKRQNFHVPLVF